jgi:hypothetical protein
MIQQVSVCGQVTDNLRKVLIAMLSENAARITIHAVKCIIPL